MTANRRGRAEARPHLKGSSEEDAVALRAELGEAEIGAGFPSGLEPVAELDPCELAGRAGRPESPEERCRAVGGTLPPEPRSSGGPIASYSTERSSSAGVEFASAKTNVSITKLPLTCKRARPCCGSWRMRSAGAPPSRRGRWAESLPGSRGSAASPDRTRRDPLRSSRTRRARATRPQ
jgi:hypothetical protein